MIWPAPLLDAEGGDLGGFCSPFSRMRVQSHPRGGSFEDGAVSQHQLQAVWGCPRCRPKGVCQKGRDRTKDDGAGDDGGSARGQAAQAEEGQEKFLAWA